MSTIRSRSCSLCTCLGVLLAAAGELGALAEVTKMEYRPRDLRWDFHRVAVSVVTARWDLVEIHPTETLEQGSVTAFRLGDGSSFSGALSWSEDEGFEFAGTMQVQDDGFAFDTTVEDLRGRHIARRTLVVPNYRSSILEVMEDPATGTRLALRVTARAETIPAFEAYPDPPSQLKVDRSIMIMNGDTVIAAGVSLGGSMASPCLAAFVPDQGAYLFAPHEFPGAAIVGGIDEESLRFELDGQRFEMWTKQPMLPEGRWLVWGKKLSARKASDLAHGGGAMHVRGPSQPGLGIMNCQ